MKVRDYLETNIPIGVIEYAKNERGENCIIRHRIEDCLDRTVIDREEGLWGYKILYMNLIIK